MFCQSQAFPTEKKTEKKQILSVFVFFSIKSKYVKKKNFKIWLQKRQIGNPDTDYACNRKKIRYRRL